MRPLVPLLAALACAVCPAAAAAQPPANDARTAPQALGSLPARVSATTVEATLEPDEPTACAPVDHSVWFSFDAPAGRQVLLALDAAGDMDAVIDVFARRRSQLEGVACAQTNRRGEATLDFDAAADADYLVRVAPLANSVADAFTLRAVLPDEPARAPGDRLAEGGVSATVDRFANPDDAWYVDLTEGRTYRFNLVTAGSGCAAVELFPPGGFSQSPLRSFSCDRHVVMAAPRSGRYTLRVRAPRASRERLPYRLRAGRAGRDDTAPGLALADDRRVRGRLEGNELDALDLYSFTVERRSNLRLRLATGAAFELQLLTEGGRRLGCDCGGEGRKELERGVRPGRYFAAVRARDGASGRYVLSRLARTITRARTLVAGSRNVLLRLGARAELAVHVTPAVSGRATLVLERHDPLAGWLYHATFHPRVSGTSAAVGFVPPFPGRWRVTGSYDGTRRASASRGGTATFRVAAP